jgi:hypothetical protein
MKHPNKLKVKRKHYIFKQTPAQSIMGGREREREREREAQIVNTWFL